MVSDASTGLQVGGEHTLLLCPGARVKIMRSIQIGQPKAAPPAQSQQPLPRQQQIHEEHMEKEWQSRPATSGGTGVPTKASASTRDVASRAEHVLPNRTHVLPDGAWSHQHSSRQCM
jgi:hypothetical protein